MKRFRIVLPVAQSVLALILGGIGEWQRRRILSGPSFGGDGWHTSAAFHVWPWPLKFAVITNMPMLLPMTFLPSPAGGGAEETASTVLVALTFLSGPVFWYWIGSRMDRQWILRNRNPWTVISIFNLFALTGSLIDLGHVGYIPFGFVLWIFWIIATWCMSWRFPKPVIVRQNAATGE